MAEVRDGAVRGWRSFLVGAVLGLGLSIAEADARAETNDPPDHWFAFTPGPGSVVGGSALDLRSLNEPVAGEHGFIRARDGHFVRSGDGQPVRFWAVNGPPDSARTPEDLSRLAHRLAQSGVNLVRAHGAVFDKKGESNPERVRRLQAIVAAMKGEGIYTHLSIYFPLWLDPQPGTPWLPGYNGHQHAFASLMFDRGFQEHYRGWWKAVLLTPGVDGKRLIDEPALFGVEVQNEDSLFFWTFNAKTLPLAQWALVETRFAEWLLKRHGSLDKAQAAWGGGSMPEDHPEARRMGIRPLWNIAHEKTARDRDTAAFLFEIQDSFYRETIGWLRELGFRGVITASNWNTADNQVLGPLERWSYASGDFIDRHGYFGGVHTGEASEWSIRVGQQYSDRSALRFEGAKPGGARSYGHPAADVKYNGLPTMLSETTWNRPNRHRGEAPLFFAAYGALQDSDAIVHFALDGAEWSVKPGYFMQPWTLLAPTQFGQFPAAARVYREGLVRPGEILADVSLSRDDLLQLKGTPLPLDAAFDELRMRDVPSGEGTPTAGLQVDPLIHFAGRTRSQLGVEASRRSIQPLGSWIDRERKQVRSTTGELVLDYAAGLLELRAPQAQGAMGNLAARTKVSLPDLEVSSPLDLVQIVVVSLDGQPLSRSSRMLLQVMTEERPTGWRTSDAGPGLHRIESIGTDPWQVREFRGSVSFRRSDAASLRVIPLDLQGAPKSPIGDARHIELQSATLYYEIRP